jgi:hypothetical protein
MTANDSLERRIADHYAAEATPRAPDWLLRSTLETIDATPQRRRVLIRVPWRFPHMNNFAKLAIAAVVVIAVGAVGLSLLRPQTPSDVGGQPIASPSASASPTPGTSPSASPVSPPALTGTYTSDRYGFSISYPAGWVPRPATEAWTTSFPDFASTSGDVIYDPVLQGDLWMVVASQPLADGTTATQWVDDVLATGISGLDSCDPPIEPVMIDGNQGRRCGSPAAAVTAGGRGYAVLLYVSGDRPAVLSAYDQAYFDEILATLRLQPEDAVDTQPSASP